MNDDPRYNPRTFWLRRTPTQMGRLFAAPLGALKLVGTLVLLLVGIGVVVFLMGLLFAGHISHV